MEFDDINRVRYGLFNLEMINDSSNKIIPLLSISNCNFTNLNSIGTISSYLTFIQTISEFATNIILNNITF